MQTSSSNDAATLPGSSSATGNSYSTAAGQAMARLQPVTTATGFSFPPIYSFPPFFTKQRNTKTANAQLSQWTSLILDYCRHHRMYKVDLGANTTGHELWCNADISRRVDSFFQADIMGHLVSNGLAMYDPPLSKSVTPTAAFIYYRKPEEWGEIIYLWVAENGLIGSILTLYELTTGGDLAPSAEFYELPSPILKLALAHLIKTGRAQTFKGTSGEDGDGVKFF